MEIPPAEIPIDDPLHALDDPLHASSPRGSHEVGGSSSQVSPDDTLQNILTSSELGSVDANQSHNSINKSNNTNTTNENTTNKINYRGNNSNRRSSNTKNPARGSANGTSLSYSTGVKQKSMNDQSNEKSIKIKGEHSVG